MHLVALQVKHCEDVWDVAHVAKALAIPTQKMLANAWRGFNDILLYSLGHLQLAIAIAQHAYRSKLKRSGRMDSNVFGSDLKLFHEYHDRERTYLGT